MRGFDRLVSELRAVYLRRSLTRRPSGPKWRPRIRRYERDQAPPIFACVQDSLELGTPASAGRPGLPVVLTKLSDHLRPQGDAAPELHVPHAVVPLEDTSPPDGPDTELQDVDPKELGRLVKLLDQATRGLNDSRAGGYDFPRYDLVRWLMQQSFGDPKPRRRTQVRRALYRRAVGADRADAGGFWAKIQDRLPLLWLIVSLTTIPIFFRIRHSGRVPLLGGPYRWLRGQQYVPRGDDSLFDLALRLTEDHWAEQDPERLAGLLVNAFLEDLRAGFGRFVLVGRYRATHPILMVGPISRTNGGYLLVRMVATVRNDTQRFDPLLLVTAGRKVPPLAVEPDSSPTETLVEWRERQEQESLRRRVGAWLYIVPIEAPRQTTPPRPQLPRRFGRRPDPVPVAPEPEEPLERVKGPTMRTPLGGWGIILLTLVLLAGTYGGLGVLHDRRHCGGDGFTWLAFESRTPSVTKVGGDCVGPPTAPTPCCSRASRSHRSGPRSWSRTSALPN